jgi:predicted nucleotidyltransferase
MRRLGRLREQFVLVGATVLELWLDPDEMIGVRVTLDVDFVVRLNSVPEVNELGDELRRLGFKNAPGHIDRWMLDGIQVDIVDSMGFHGSVNRWYEEAIDRSVRRDLGDGSEIRVITPPYFVATKLEAFLSRGKQNYYDAPDLEDVLMLLERRPETADEIGLCPLPLRQFVAQTVSGLLKNSEFMNALPGHVEATADLIQTLGRLGIPDK